MRKSPSSKSSGDFYETAQQGRSHYHFRGVSTYVAAGDEAPSERGVGDDLDPEFSRGFQEPNGLIFDVQCEGRILDLDG